MAHDNNGRIYVDTQNGVGISVEEVRTVLAEAAGVDLSRSSLINRWAKKKPLAAGNVGGYTDAQAKAINYGLYVPYYTTFRDMVRDIRRGVWSGAANFDSSKTPWTNGGLGAGDWARLLDFNGYQHNAPQPVAQIFARNTIVGLGRTPEYEADLAAYNAEYLTLADMGFTINGTDYRGNNMYVGMAVCDGISDSLPVLASQNFWTRAVYTAEELNSQVDRSIVVYNDFAFDRGRIPPTYNAPACLFLSSLYGTIELDDTGVFVPVIPTRSVLGLEFVRPSITPISHDPMNMWWFDGTDDLTIIIKCFPNGNFNWKLDLAIQGQDGHYWLDTDGNGWTLPLGYVMDMVGDTEQQFPVYVKFSTGMNGGDRIVTAYVYIVHPDTTFYDIYNGVDYQGNPLTEPGYPSDIARGTIFDGETPIVANIAYAAMVGNIGNSSYGYTTQADYDIGTI